MEDVNLNTHKSQKPLLTMLEAADALSVPYWKLQRAVKSGQLPFYTLFNSRKLVKLSEVIALIEASKTGGSA